MATFKVGQRVRITQPGFDPVVRHAGRTGAITELFTKATKDDLRKYGPCHGVLVDGLPAPYSGAWAIPVDFLAPLTDPKAEEFIERIKKLGREPVGHKETVEVRK